MKVLTVQEYNQQIKTFYPQSWAQSSKKNGFIAVKEDFSDGFWGEIRQSAINKFNRTVSA